MTSHIRTSKANKELVSELTRKHSLGAENVIARLAIAHSLKEGEKLDLNNIEDSGGKEYSRKVLFGEYENIYLGMICNFYEIHRGDKSLGRLVKMHLDDGLKRLEHQSDPLSNII